ncbi:hypothetical protein KUTeg_023002 [Tegillarca granosa]|uniref:Uncharacterized protein n=1 Tax=Tegillarca granosa TaxID=220873 RepID=A0ABQ9E106_TEGGR|nr:hypothetical protein KUTeg_023002 [Tegillarca granosa]
MQYNVFWLLTEKSQISALKDGKCVNESVDEVIEVSLIDKSQESSSWSTLNQEAYDTNHRLVHIKGIKKPCLYCRVNKITTVSGWKVYTFIVCHLFALSTKINTTVENTFEVEKPMKGLPSIFKKQNMNKI